LTEWAWGPSCRSAFGPLPTCAWGGQPNLSLATNYQDLWYAAPAESEAGWGVNFTHQGDKIFATWFTYNLDGTPLWLSAEAVKTPTGVYSGPAPRQFHRVKWKFPTGNRIVASPVIEERTIFFGSDDGNVYAVDSETGRQMWKTKTRGPVSATAAIADRSLESIVTIARDVRFA